MPTSSTSSSTSSASSDNPGANSEQKDQLMTLLKKEVKHIMEESVMLKTIHEDSSTVTSLCAVVDTCLSLGECFWKIVNTNCLGVPFWGFKIDGL